MLHYALAAFDACSEFAQTVLVLAPDDNHFDGRRFGPLRFAVLVHDAARPGITPALIRALVEALRDDPVGGILALPVADTLKREQAPTAKGGLAAVLATESRDGLWQAQTPQMFRLGMLRHALEDALASGAEVTDEASAIERIGHAPKLVRGSLRNFKVTYPEDFALAEAFLGAAKSV